MRPRWFRGRVVGDIRTIFGASTRSICCGRMARTCLRLELFTNSGSRAKELSYLCCKEHSHHACAGPACWSASNSGNPPRQQPAGSNHNACPISVTVTIVAAKSPDATFLIGKVVRRPGLRFRLNPPRQKKHRICRSRNENEAHGVHVQSDLPDSMQVTLGTLC